MSNLIGHELSQLTSRLETTFRGEPEAFPGVIHIGHISEASAGPVAPLGARRRSSCRNVRSGACTCSCPSG
jgi:hypothetical protein